MIKVLFKAPATNTGAFFFVKNRRGAKMSVMAKKIIIANWKMNPPSLKEAKRIFAETRKAAVKLKKTETVVCPPFVYLRELKPGKNGLKLGAQDIFWDDKKTSYTGEISAAMLKDAGVKYAIVGHSERREHLGETDEMISKKIKTALRNGLKAVFCVGERDRDTERRYLRFVRNEIESGLKGLPRELAKNLILAYEPVWAIGKSGKNAARPGDVLNMVIYARKALLPMLGKERAKKIPVLYGGSVDAGNAVEFLRFAGVQGLLVGHKSVVPGVFGKILSAADGCR